MEQDENTTRGNQEVECKFCGQTALALFAHLHQGEWVCSDCWDDRLKVTE